MKLKEQYITSMINSLYNDLVKVVDNCVSGGSFTNRSYNLHDSYGGAIYYNGVLQKEYIVGKIATKTKKWYGRTIEGNKAIAEYIDNYKPKNSGFEVIALNGFMPYYGGVVEYKYDYKVIAMSVDQLNIIASKYKDARVSILKG